MARRSGSSQLGMIGLISIILLFMLCMSAILGPAVADHIMARISSPTFSQDGVNEKPDATTWQDAG